QRVIAPPPEFPVTWSRPEEATYHWTRDREHMPDPITPMFFSAAAVMAIASRERTLPVYDEAIVKRFDKVINSYIYTSLIPYEGPPEALETRARRNRDKVWSTSRQLEELWETVWRPELEAHWAFWETFDLQHATLAALAEHLEESLRRGARLYEIHYLMGPPMWFAIDAFETLYCDLFPEKTPLDAHQLLQGFDNKTLEIGRALWRLRDLAKGEAIIGSALACATTAETLAALEETEPGRTFLAALHEFLATYGGRSDLWDWGYPSWQDNPAPVLNNLRNYLAQPDRDLTAELEHVATVREQAIVEARQALASYPQPVVERFETTLRAAQVALVLTENHTYYIDFNGFGWIHRVIKELGRRLDAHLYEPDDVFYLTIDELREMLHDESCTREMCAHAARAAGRRVEQALWAQVDEPRELGTRPEKPLTLYSPDARRTLRYTGGWAADPTGSPDQTNEKPDGLLYGQPGSPGTVRGRARVILSLADAHRLQPGDILVTTTTAPPWTPLFLTAAALVTDAGGLLSHGAVVSREYGIPAVVGTHDATTRITDGQEIEVDGRRGSVRLL
ncbi:MAG: hypothetical protein JXB35_10625, partial [Anaerolineae bacterium]|nr:hypothetical protein [Anaerolineae bacterium]